MTAVAWSPATLELPSWCGGHTVTRVDGEASLEDYTVLVVYLEDCPDDDAIDYLEGVVSYAWTKNMRGATPISEGAVHAFDNVVVFEARVSGRRVRTRSRTQATHDLVSDIRSIYVDGSPIRRDGTRLIARPSHALPALADVLVG